ncbi:MAG: hypothetical protein ACFB9N_12730 [Geitlerinemataceae cyanobacterium]
MEPVEIAIFGGLGLVAASAVGSVFGKSKEETQKICDDLSASFRDATKSGLVVAVKAFDDAKESFDEARLNFDEMIEEARAEAKTSREPGRSPRRVDISSD